LRDIEAGLIDVVVVYKIDRLSRSLLDFLNMVRMFDKHNVSFVSVTQQFNTSTPMGRLMINVLMSFAEYERELTGERIRDKIASSKKKGMWMGGTPPLGYDIKERKLLINDQEAVTINLIFGEFIRYQSTTTLVKQLRQKNIKGKAWVSSTGKVRAARFMDKGTIYKILRNPIYAGKIRHKNETYPGEHKPIISMETWEKVQAILTANATRERRVCSQSSSLHLLRGILFDAEGRALTPSSTKNRHGKLYRYYVSTLAIKSGYGDAAIASVPAIQIEEMVITQIRDMLATPEMMFKTYQRAREIAIGIDIEDVRSSFQQFNALWDKLFPVEQNHLVKLLIQRIVVADDSIDITYHANGLVQLCKEFKHHMAAA